MAKRKRDFAVTLRFTEQERELIAEKMTAADILNREAYLRKMALDGYVLRLDLSGIDELVRLLPNATNNLNQIAKRVNETGNIYEDDIKDIKNHYNGVWEQANEILRSLANIQK